MNFRRHVATYARRAGCALVSPAEWGWRSTVTTHAARGTSASIFLVLLLAPAARAQEERIDSPYRWIPRGLRVAPVGGYLEAGRGSLEFGPGPTSLVGGRFRARVSSPLSIELGALLGPAERFVIDPRLETGPAPVDTVASTWLAAQLALQVAFTGRRTWHGIHPYLLLGTGLLIGIDEDESEVFADTALADFRYNLNAAPLFQAGLGAEVHVSDRIGIGFEVRDYLVRLKAPDGFFRPEVLETIEEAGATAPNDTQWPSNLEFSVSLWYYLR